MLPLLRTKTTIPRSRLRQVERPALLDRVSEGMQGALTLIVAPAGFGKTTLAAAWATQTSLPVAWLSLQPTDRSPERFLIYLIQALQTISTRLGQTTLALLQSGSQEGALHALLNDLAEFPGDFALILDDFHAADCPEVARIVQFLLKNRSPNLHLLITSRAAPALSLTRLRALGQVAEITAVDLRFSPEEVRDFLDHSMGVRVSMPDLARLTELTEGWAVGLQLAGLAYGRAGAQQPAGWRLPAGQALIFDYLAEEVLRHEPPEVQDLLKTTALFDRFCAALCEALPVGVGARAKEILTHVERANLFLVPLDAAGVWYRYHALFSDFLRRQTPAEPAGILYRAASQWFEQNDLMDDAIHYAAHAADYERAARLLEGQYIDMIQRGEQTALFEVIDAMPAEVLERRPRLWLAKGWGSIVGLNFSEAIRCVEKAEALGQPGQDSDRLRGEAKALRVLANIFGGKTAAVEEITEAFVLLSEQDDFLHSLLHFNLGLHYVMEGETGRALEAFGETLRLTEQLKNPLVTIVSLVQLGETRQMRGALGLSERAYQQVIQYARETLGEHTFLLGMPYISYSELLREQNRFQESAWFAEQGIAYCYQWQPVASMDGQISLARLRAAQGRWDEAFERLEQARQVAATSVSVLDDTFVAIHMVRLALLQGDRAKAERWINAYELDSAFEEMYYHLWEMARLVLLRARVASLPDRPSDAPDLIAALTSLIGTAEQRERVSPVIEAFILRAYAEQAARLDPAASLSKALTLGAQSGYARIFADEGQPLLLLLEHHRDRIHAPRSYIEQIIGLLHAAPGLEQPAPARVVAAPAAEPLIPLTRRELDILERLASGKSNQEIAAECSLALTTVKKHVANILSKLDVSNRTQAAAVARQRGWIP